ncbi:acyl-CoA synthetase (AMP-forming)/AMP-acid ligase II [Fluviicoccus keumensis]|uniref:Acyl-CoA synthetase (AMP-forming)/AMP-acid ligase II n=1 Tax=Fluviicoccus keumensis TaxID=1435465 RepID=A0A4V2G6C1_9GAMM|nr:fatty acid CoA ligase family protein [Fluviicoccus keumensis]RZU48196.1 acyl-CoA synthetase (AMP-forming)/AMP-acid ligase II [Fluviicoccus keumensis]
MSGSNLVQPLFAAWDTHPDKSALRIPRMRGVECLSEQHLTFGQLKDEVGRYQRALDALDLKKGDRVLVLSRVRAELYVLMVALLGLGLVPVLIDRGMSAGRIRAAIRLSGAQVAIGESDILRYWWFFPPMWWMKRLALDGKTLGVEDFNTWLPTHFEPRIELLAKDAHGLITYTSGSTGVPKGADRTHDSLIAQHHAIREHWQDQPDDIDCPSFPVLVLHNLCCGITTVLPKVDLATPGRFDPVELVKQLQQEGVTRLSAAPAFMQHLCDYAIAHQVQLPGIRAVAIGGSTLPSRLVNRLSVVFPAAHIVGVYGSTEAEPIADVQLDELLREGDSHDGHLVGYPARSATVCIVPIGQVLKDDAKVRRVQCAAMTIGEVLVSGKHVLKGYIDNPDATRESKIPRADGTVWHRTGDAGYIDERGRLWLVGRIKDGIKVGDRIIWPYPLEKELDDLPGIHRAAAIAWDGRLLLVLESASATPLDMSAIVELMRQSGIFRVSWATVPALPVDGRHNSKIDRLLLRKWLEQAKLRPQDLELS